MILRVDVLAFRLADLLEDDLLGGLCRNAAQSLGRLGELNLVAGLDLGVLAVDFPGLGDGNLGVRIGHRVDNGLDGEQFDLADLRIELGLECLVGLEYLARRRDDRFLHRLDDDVRVDALLLGQRVNGLQQRIRAHVSLELHIETGAGDLPNRHPHQSTPL